MVVLLLFVVAAPFLAGDGDDPEDALLELLRQELGKKDGALYDLCGLFLGHRLGDNIKGRIRLLRLLRESLAEWLARNAPGRPLPEIKPPPTPRLLTRKYNVSGLIAEESVPPGGFCLLPLLNPPATAPLAHIKKEQLIRLLRLVAGTEEVVFDGATATVEVTTIKPLHLRIQSLLKSLSEVGAPVSVDFEVWSTSSAVLSRLLRGGFVVEGEKRAYLEGCRRRGDAVLVASGSVSTRDWVGGCALVGRERLYSAPNSKERLWLGVAVWARPVSLGGARWLLQVAVGRTRPRAFHVRSFPEGRYEMPSLDVAVVSAASLLWESQWTLVGATTGLPDQPGTSCILLARVRPTDWRAGR